MWYFIRVLEFQYLFIDSINLCHSYNDPMRAHLINLYIWHLMTWIMNIQPVKKNQSFYHMLMCLAVKPTDQVWMDPLIVLSHLGLDVLMVIAYCSLTNIYV